MYSSLKRLHNLKDIPMGFYSFHHSALAHSKNCQNKKAKPENPSEKLGPRSAIITNLNHQGKLQNY